MKVLIVYASRTGNTEKMARLVGEGVRAEGIAAEVKKVSEATLDDLLAADAIIIGSPTYYGTMCGDIKAFLDASVEIHGKLEGKVGGAFSSAGVFGGGAETTVLDIVKALLVHGLVVPGNPAGPHYGAVSVGAPAAKAARACRILGERVARLAKAVGAGSGEAAGPGGRRGR